MNDPHVERLRYGVSGDGNTSYDDPPPVEWKTAAFHMRLADGIATCELKEHFSEVEQARRTVDEFLDGWRVHMMLTRGRPELAFAFQNADVIDRDPRPEAGGVVAVAATGTINIEGMAPIVHLTRKQYPEPPTRFVLTPDVDMMRYRYEQYEAGREPLQGMGYALVTWFERSAGGRLAACKRYQVSDSILRRIRTLTSERGDPLTARKFEPKRPIVELTRADAAWLERAIKRLILRAGEWAADPTRALAHLTMSDLGP